MLANRQIPHTDLRPSTFALGAPQWGTGVKMDQAQRLYEAFRQAGGDLFDTAHVYAAWLPDGSGTSERALGRILAADPRSGECLVATKGGHPAFGKNYARPDAYLSPESIGSDIRESLERLGRGRIDLYYLHRDDRRVPVGEIVSCLNEHIAGGRLRAIGVSNWSTARLAEANVWADQHGQRGFVATQPQFSLAHSTAPEPDHDPANRFLKPADLAYLVEKQIALIPYSPTANGYFATAGAKGKGFDNPVSCARLERAQQLAKELRCTPNQVALAYLLHLPLPVIPVLGTADLAHLADGLAAADVRLTERQVTWLCSDGHGG
jgi:aryl-alcohol dehydrogenase-like predicted oxidoreductase